MDLKVRGTELLFLLVIGRLMNGLFSMLGKIMRNRIVLLSEFVKLCLAFPYSYHFLLPLSAELRGKNDDDEI